MLEYADKKLAEKERKIKIRVEIIENGMCVW